MSVLQAFEGRDLASLLEDRVAQHGARTFLVWAPFEGEPRACTYAQFLDDVRRVAGGLRAYGVKAGDRVLLNAENCPAFLVTWFACAWIGAVCVATHPKSAGDELGYFVRHTGAVGAVTQPEYVDVLSHHCPELGWIVATDAFASLRREPVERASPGPAGRLGMMFTSGTTSRPKAVLFHHANALWAARQGAAHLNLRSDDACLLFLPIFHVAGLFWTLFPALWAGARVVLQPKFSGTRFWDAAIEHGATVGSHVQFSSAALSKLPAPPPHAFRVWGNSFWSPEYEAHFRVPIVGWWGMTELVSPGIVGGGAQQPGSIGRPAPGYEVRIVGESGGEAQTGELGELLVRGERGVALFAEYYGDPRATREAFDAQGWFRTGDRVRLHEDGSISFVERVKDIIKVGGEGVSAADVERVVRLVEGVLDAAVVGRPDPLYGEVCVAFVVQAPGALGVAGRVLERCRAELAPFKVPKDVRIVEALPRANLNKIAKGELRRMAALSAAAATNSRG